MTDLTPDEMIDRMRGWATRRAALMLPHSEVEDAAQEVSVAVWRALPRLRESADPWPFLVKVGGDALRSYARRFYGRTPVPVDTTQHDEPTRYDTTSAAALDRITHPDVWEAVAELSPRERDAVMLLDVLDVSPGDAHRRLGLSPEAGALRQARSRAHSKLRESLMTHLPEAA